MNFRSAWQHNYSVLATPAEGLSGRFTQKDKKSFGIIPGVTDREYYTNSNHVPVYYRCSARHKAEIEAPYHDLTRGGHIFYVEIDGDATHNPDAIMSVVDMMDRYNMGIVLSITTVTAVWIVDMKTRPTVWKNAPIAEDIISIACNGLPDIWSVRQIAGIRRNWLN